jgi:hypothetical protein
VVIDLDIFIASGGIAPQSALLPRRHCERSEAIQSLSAEGFWIASLRSQ